LWRIYCGSTEGVAIQTTFGRLRDSAGNAQLLQVSYGTPGNGRQTPTKLDLVTKKRSMFDYEREVRLVYDSDGKVEKSVFGHRLAWDPEKSTEIIRVHPEGDGSFMETVSEAVLHYAPALKDHIAWSAMKDRPPLKV
jgi:hypothetical protein